MSQEGADLREPALFFTGHPSRDPKMPRGGTAWGYPPQGDEG